MKASREFRPRTWKSRLAGAAFGLVCSLSSLAAVFSLFASASGELEPVLARFRTELPASAVASKALARPASRPGA